MWNMLFHRQIKGVLPLMKVWFPSPATDQGYADELWSVDCISPAVGAVNPTVDGDGVFGNMLTGEPSSGLDNFYYSFMCWLLCWKTRKWLCLFVDSSDEANTFVFILNIAIFGSNHPRSSSHFCCSIRQSICCNGRPVLHTFGPVLGWQIPILAFALKS